MSALAEPLQLKDRLPRTWPAFFERHGNFTVAQLATIPSLLDGQNVMLCAPTASGKTEAAVAPLIERFCDPVPARRRGLAILYITPTRALVSDLASRLAHPLTSLGLRLGIKTGDYDTLRSRTAFDLLLTTPESLDSLLTTRARMLVHLQAIVIDEIHLFDGTPRGDQLRVLINRIRRIKAYASAQDETLDAGLQYVALSATVVEPDRVAGRYFGDARIVRAGERSPLDVVWIALDRDSPDALSSFLSQFQARGWKKALVFCNSRSEVESYAATVRANSPFGNAVYVHYSNLEAGRRREIEHEFGTHDAAICFASTTLELGIDIGSIDIVLLIGPPGSQASFLQRIGRANRRSSRGRRATPVVCLYRSRLERLLFEVLCAQTEPGGHVSGAFHPSVAIQQIFSLIRQSPLAAVRLPELVDYFAHMLSPEDLRAIVARLVDLRYLAPGRPGEWRAGENLQRLFDEQGSPRCSLSIFGNLQIDTGSTLAVRDQHTHQVVAQIERHQLQDSTFMLEGRTVSVEWQDGNALWIRSSPGLSTGERTSYRSARQSLERTVVQQLPERLGLGPNTAPLIPWHTGYIWFHWLGDIYGRALLELLRYTIAAERSTQPGLCVLLPEEPRVMPIWTAEQVHDYLGDSYRAYEPMLALGPFHPMLPTSLRRRAVIEQFDVPAFLEAVATLRLVRAPAVAGEDLTALLDE